MPTPRVTIDELPEELTPGPTNLLVVQDAGTTKKMTFATLQALAAGPPGAPGAPGATGPGVPTGGAINQGLVKNSATNYDTEWTDVVANAGGVSGIRALSQAAYDGLTPDPTTLYIIV